MHRFAFCLLALALTPLLPAAGEGDRPNVLFIAIDDLNDWIGCLGGHPQALTPNIDRLAEKGVLFTNAHCAAPACNPSRAAVFSGQMPDATGVWSNRSRSITKLKPDAPDLVRQLGEAGYRTLGTGKLLHGRRQGAFDEYFSVEQRWSPLPGEKVIYTEAELPSKGTDSPRKEVKHNGKTYVLPLNRMPSDRRPDEVDGESHDWGGWEVPDTEFGDTQITDWAISKLQEKAEKPFFLGVGYYRPHIPLWAPARFFERFENDPGQLPPVREDDLADLSPVARQWALEAITAGSHDTVLRFNQWQAAVEAYLACVTYVDHEVGRLVDALEASDLAENTIILLWSDHGWHLGEKQHWGKWTGWERSTRVPLLAVPPRQSADRFAAGARCGAPVGLIDLFPTLMEWCGVEAPADLDGQSLLPLVKNPSTSTGRALVTLFDPGNLSVRDERWRFIRYADGSEELYDLESDPHEWSNLAGSEETKQVTQSLRKAARRYLHPKVPAD